MHLSANHLATSDKGIPPTKFGGEKWGNSHPKMQRKIRFRQVYCWWLRNPANSPVEVGSSYATNMYVPGFKDNIQTGGHHVIMPRPFLFQKSSSEVQRELGLDYAFANTLEVDETTGRWVAWRDENWSGGFTYFLFSPLLGEMIQFD